jgi:DNA-binding NarL/FixJ family response regulator
MVIGVYSSSELFSKGLQCLLRTNLHFQKIEHLQSPDAILNRTQDGRQLDLMIIDIDDFLSDFLAFLRHLLQLKPDSKVLLLGSHCEESMVDMCRLVGASGYVEKSANFEKLHLAIDLCLDGKIYFPPTKAGRAKHQVSNFFTSLREDYRLSDREMEIMQLIFCQCETNEIADKLSLSPHTVRTHRKNIFRKLRIHSLSGLLHLMP